MINMKYRLFNGDCLEENHQIEDGAVDLILTDLPYGTMKGLEAKNYECFNGGQWDIAIAPSKVFEIANRILRKNGKMVLFSQEPYTAELIKNAIPNVPFSYRAVWIKDNFANSLLAKKAMVGLFEDILIFSKQHDFEGLHPLRKYSLKLRKFTNYSRLKFTEKLGHGGHQHFMEGNKESSQFSLCTLETYNELIEHFGIDTMEGFMPFEELKRIDDEFKSEFSSTFNLWQGGKYKSNVLEYRKDYNGYHPTQKPIALLEDLIQTFSNEDDLVVDLTMGSGSTGVACRNTKRNFVGIEKDKNYFDIAEMRIHKTLKAVDRVVDEHGYYQTSIFDFLTV